LTIAPEVDQGGLIFKKVDSYMRPSLKGKGDLEYPGPWPGAPHGKIETITKAINDAMQAQFKTIEDRVLKALANQNRLFLPGAGNFLMKDPCFNYRGDLLATLEYDG